MIIANVGPVIRQMREDSGESRRCFVPAQVDAHAKCCEWHPKGHLLDEELTTFQPRTRPDPILPGFEPLCDSLGIEHRLTKPRRPQTNGMVERLNGRLEQVLQKHRFNSAEGLRKTLHRYLWLYD